MQACGHAHSAPKEMILSRHSPCCNGSYAYYKTFERIRPEYRICQMAHRGYLFCPAHVDLHIVAVFDEVQELHVVVGGLLTGFVRGHIPEVDGRPCIVAAVPLLKLIEDGCFHLLADLGVDGCGIQGGIFLFNDKLFRNEWRTLFGAENLAIPDASSGSPY